MRVDLFSLLSLSLLEPHNSSSATDVIRVERSEEELEVDEEGFIAEESDDEEKTEKEIMKERVYGEKKSQRHTAPPQRTGYLLNSTQLKFS